MPSNTCIHQINYTRIKEFNVYVLIKIKILNCNLNYLFEYLLIMHYSDSLDLT